MFDKTRPGYLSIPELAKLMRTLGIFTNSDESELFREVTRTGTCEQLAEFVAFADILRYLGQKNTFRFDRRESEFRAIFNTFDESGDGFICEDELFEAMGRFGEKISREELRDIMVEADSNNDGQIDYEEFVKMMSMGFGK